jgi:beta-phosphoglucomutase family hydrolase
MRAIIWDLDGTIADTEELHFHSWRQVLAAYGINHTYADFMQGFGRRNAEIIPELVGDAATPEIVETIAQDKEITYRTLLRQSNLGILPGVATWLERFQQVGLQQAIASSGPMANIVATVETLHIGDHFDSLISGARLPKGKPDPTIFLLAAAALGVMPEHCIVIEDSLPGIEAARQAGMFSVAVGKVIHTSAFHERIAAVPGRPCTPVDSLEQLRWEAINIPLPS